MEPSTFNSQFENFSFLLVLIDNGNENLALRDDAVDKFASRFYSWGDYIYGIILLIIGLISVLGNTLAVIVFRRKGRDIAVSEVFLLNIAIVDLLLAGASYPATVISAFSHRWIFYEIGCTIYGATCYFLGVATIMSLTSLAVFRYLRTCYPQKVHFLTSTRTWARVVLPIYLYSLVWAILPLLGWGSYDVEPFGLSCTLAWSQSDLGGRSYILTASVCCVFLPTVVIIVSHVAMIIHIRRASQLQTTKRSGRQARKLEILLLRVSFGVSFGFIMAWLPYTAFSLFSAFGNDFFPPWLTSIPVILAKSSIAYNPIIYVLLTRRYRLDFTKTLVELISCLSRLKRQQQNEGGEVPAPNDRQEMAIDQQVPLLDIQQEQQITELETNYYSSQTPVNNYHGNILFITDENKIADHETIEVMNEDRRSSKAWTIALIEREDQQYFDFERVRNYPSSV